MSACLLRITSVDDCVIILHEAEGTNRVRILIKYEVSTAVTMKNAVFSDIKTQFVPHKKHITSPLQSPAG
jgi:hypothetical protein